MLKQLEFLVFLVKIVHRKHNPKWFIIYMYLNYCEILQQQKKYKLKGVTTQFLIDLVGENNIWDVDNTVIVHNKKQSKGLKVVRTDYNKRHVFVVTRSLADNLGALVSYNLLHNLKNASDCQLLNCKEQLKIAEEVEVVVVNTCSNYNGFVIDTILENFFKKPKLLNLGDLIKISMLDYGEQCFFLSDKIPKIQENLYFKCTKIIYGGKNVSGSYVCVRDKTTLKLATHIQSFIPKILNCQCPWGLEGYFNEIIKAARPFVDKNLETFMPIFLLEGAKGSGKNVIVQCVAEYFGMHLYTVDQFEISANVYAQNETKLRNVAFAAKMTAPTILVFKNFENFGKNNEGEYDERLIGNFQSEMKNLFIGNCYPILVICCSNNKNIPIGLKRTFLKIFELKSPTESERESILEWFFQTLCIEINCDLNKIANRTHGFLFEDLKTLIDFALIDFYREQKINLEILDFSKFSKALPEKYLLEALDFMQSNYSSSIGAPKVPQVKWEDVGGLTEVKNEIIKTIKMPLRYPDLMKSSGLKRTGILLYGPPGTGKTLIAKAVATECGICFLSVKGPELLNMYVGQSEQNVREVFQKARDASPCIIFFDELDSLAPNRGASGDSGGVMDRIVSQLLAEMDGLNKTGTVFIIGATNRPDLIDPALLRPGRIDKLLYVGPCLDNQSKASVLKALTRKFAFDKDSIIDDVVNLCSENFSGADFYAICAGAWMAAVRRLITTNKNDISDVIVTLEDFKTSIENVQPSINPKDLEYFHQLSYK